MRQCFGFLVIAAYVWGAMGCQSAPTNPKVAPLAPPSWLFTRGLGQAAREEAREAAREQQANTTPPEFAAVVEKPAAPRWPSGAKSKMLPSGLYNPMPGGVVSGYRADTGLDVMGIKMPVYAIASGWIDYAETGHTLWTGPRDTANCVRIQLDEPIAYKGRKITHIYYAHLSKLVLVQPEGQSPRTRVEAGDLLGTSGVANGSWHLHLGFLLDGEVEQYYGTFLYEDEVREVMGGYRNGNRLPKE
jgi:murein DD-endopeptidase MepM/ murein hydrolase activator NlpD